ncbi:unnamed protein product [Closterium sp. NIES-53]
MAKATSGWYPEVDVARHAQAKDNGCATVQVGPIICVHLNQYPQTSHAETTTHGAAGTIGSRSDAAAAAADHHQGLHSEVQTYHHQSYRLHCHHSLRCLHRRHQSPHSRHQSHCLHHLHCRPHHRSRCPHHHSRCPHHRSRCHLHLHHLGHPCPCCCGTLH